MAIQVITHTFTIVGRWFEPGEGYQRLEATITGTMEDADRHAREMARSLDADFGSERNWSVNFYNDDRPEYGSYYEYFHGRVS